MYLVEIPNTLIFKSISEPNMNTRYIQENLAKALKVKSVPNLDWELAGRLIEKEKISLVRSYTKWTAFYVGVPSDSRGIEVTADTALEAVFLCFIEKKLGSEI